MCSLPFQFQFTFRSAHVRIVILHRVLFRSRSLVNYIYLNNYIKPNQMNLPIIKLFDARAHSEVECHDDTMRQARTANCEISIQNQLAETNRGQNKKQQQHPQKHKHNHKPIGSNIPAITTRRHVKPLLVAASEASFNMTPTTPTTNTSIKPNATEHLKSTNQNHQNHHNQHHIHHCSKQQHCQTMSISKLARTINCYTMFLLSLLSLSISSCLSSTIMHNNNQANIATPQDSAGQVFTCGKLYYRTFYLDQQRNVLYVGAM